MIQKKLDWSDTRILVPNFRNGDVFYVIYKKEIIAIRLDKSYINLGYNIGQFNVNGVATPANNNDNLKGNVIFYSESNNHNQICVRFTINGRYVWLYAYESVEDARNGIVSRKVVNIVNLPVYTKGYVKARISYGSYTTLDVHRWEIFLNQPKLDTCCTFKTLMFYNDGLVFSEETKPLFNIGYETEEEARNAIKSMVSQYKVCTFEDEKKETPKEYTITLTINSDMTAMDILEKIKKATEN